MSVPKLSASRITPFIEFSIRESLRDGSIPCLDSISLAAEQSICVAVNGHSINSISLANLVDDFLIFIAANNTENSMATIEMGRWYMGDEKLTAIGAWASVGHG